MKLEQQNGHFTSHFIMPFISLKFFVYLCTDLLPWKVQVRLKSFLTSCVFYIVILCFIQISQARPQKTICGNMKKSSSCFTVWEKNMEMILRVKIATCITYSQFSAIMGILVKQWTCSVGYFHTQVILGVNTVPHTCIVFYTQLELNTSHSCMYRFLHSFAKHLKNSSSIGSNLHWTCNIKVILSQMLFKTHQFPQHSNLLWFLSNSHILHARHLIT